ncbi:RNA 2'-phosphotransferase [Allorhodopirellula heiligendammensis]|uniref:RNA 2'-phosphotransferase n=1 Tax=Allorhodopirellula heiligendammensis TaxID=2714739 RepID=A0A5C6BHE6_9BACT|nr:RNA 2'-phosphotransferase [Allorhodopirellula heiligendammensis]TWU10699.1 RNA 2'-phosphotransferase [Allorhodopirellula heiligendammensis]
MNKRLTKISKYLTFILRHEPQAIGLELDDEGYLAVDELLQNANASGKKITSEQVQQVVGGHDPPLFSFSDDGSRIRVVETLTPAPWGRRKRSPWDGQR